MNSIRIDSLLNEHFAGKILISSEFVGDGSQDRDYFKRVYEDFEFGGTIENVYFTRDEDGDTMIRFKTSKGSISFYDNDTINTK